MNVLSFDVWPRGPHVAETFLHCASLFPVLVQTSERNVASTKDQGRKKNKKEQNELEINQKRQHFGQRLKASGQANRQNWKPRHL